MHLKSLEINGFKSFAKKSTLEFTSPITSIVGPNGSGKSNVAEAFRFVLGEQSIKSMRGKRGEDLIWNGGKSLFRANRASVKVVLDNSQRLLNIDFDEVSIERVVHRDSANEYFINDSPARLKDIIELLAGAHIGASGHHIISQGEADKILNANFKERREMVEDALGLKIYHYKREESERKLEKTEENLKQVELLRKEIAPHIKFLETQVKKVEKAREMRRELEVLYSEYFKRESIYIQSERERIKAEKIDPVKRKQELERELSQAKSVLEKSKDKDQKSEELLDLERKLQSLRRDRDTLVRESGRIEGEIASEERVLRRELELSKTAGSKLVELREFESVANQIEEKIQEVETSADLGFIRSAIKSISQLIRNFVSTHSAKKENALAEDSGKQVAKLKLEKEAIFGKLNALDLAEQEFITLNAKLREEIEREKDSNRDAEKAVFRIMAQENEIISILNKIESEEERIRNIEADFMRELQEAAILVGRSVLDFENFKIVNKENWEVDSKEILVEVRSGQEERRKAIEKIKIRLEDAGGAGGEDIMKEYNDAKERDSFLEREINDLHASAETLKVLIKDLEERLTTEFKNGVDKINRQFQEFFSLMFGGGTAGLEVIKQEKKKKKLDTDLDLDDSIMETDEESEEGIDVHVSLPQKRIKGLMMLSGGERALTSIALLFAISQVNPPPFIILDETDAALDEANSRKYGDMIENLAKLSQLILITHNRETMSRAGVLYGVTMGAEGFSKLLSIKFDEAVAVAK